MLSLIKKLMSSKISIDDPKINEVILIPFGVYPSLTTPELEHYVWLATKYFQEYDSFEWNNSTPYNTSKVLSEKITSLVDENIISLNTHTSKYSLTEKGKNNLDKLNDELNSNLWDKYYKTVVDYFT